LSVVDLILGLHNLKLSLQERFHNLGLSLHDLDCSLHGPDLRQPSFYVILHDRDLSMHDVYLSISVPIRTRTCLTSGHDLVDFKPVSMIWRAISEQYVDQQLKQLDETMKGGDLGTGILG
jgi:hypothetical protein